MKLNVGQFLKKNSIAACCNHFPGFLQIFLRVETAFPASGNEVFVKSFITTSVYGFCVNFKPCAFIQSFRSYCWKALLKVSVNQFSSIFSVPNSGSSFFPASGNRFSIERYSFRRVETDFFLVLFYLDQISC